MTNSRVFRPARQVFFRGKGNVLQILEFIEIPPIQPVSSEEISIIRMERQNHVAQIRAELLCLQLTKGLSRQLVPTSLESFGVHEGGVDELANFPELGFGFVTAEGYVTCRHAEIVPTAFAGYTV